MSPTKRKPTKRRDNAAKADVASAAAKAPAKADAAKAKPAAEQGVSSDASPAAQTAKLPRIDAAAPPSPAKARPSVAGARRATAPAKRSDAEAEPHAAAPEPESEATEDMPAHEEGFAEAGRAASDDAASDSRRSRTDREKKERPSAPRRARKVLSIIVGIVVVAVIACFAVFAWGRWLRYDDAADFQGTWYIEGTAVPITITADEITLAEDADFAYRIDPFAKTLSYDLGNMEGGGRYRFSEDRASLVVADGDQSWLTTLSDDLAFVVQSLWATVTGGEQPALASGCVDAVTLYRTAEESLAAAGAATSTGDAAEQQGAQQDAAAEASTDSAAGSADSADQGAASGQDPAQAASAS